MPALSITLSKDHLNRAFSISIFIQPGMTDFTNNSANTIIGLVVLVIFSLVE
jgi:hypothetical protein